MPKPDKYAASITIACEGPDAGTVRGGPAGRRRSRDGAHLAHVRSDAEYWHETFKASTPVQEHVLLVNPTRAAVVAALTAASESLIDYQGEPGWAGGQIDVTFSGHGTVSGELVLADSSISGCELLDATLAGPPTNDRRKFSFVFDSCHSGRTLAEVLTDDRHPRDFLVIDAYAASLPDELAWELDHLGHGALTFTMRRRGNGHVDLGRLAKAVDEGDDEYVRFALHSFTPNPVAYLTEGDQHSIDAINGHSISVMGAGDVEVEPETTLEHLLADLHHAKFAYPLPRESASTT